MIKSRHFLAFGLMAVCIAMPSCKSDDEPGQGGGGDATYRPGSINIKDATALINYSGEGSRAVEGEFDHAGLYKINPDGTIEAVAVTFFVDEENNTHTNEVKLSVSPGIVLTGGKNFVGLEGCQYYDEDGDLFSMYSPEVHTNLNTRLIFDKRNDKLYSLDGKTRIDTAIVSIYKLVEENDRSLLVMSHAGCVYRMSFSGNKADIRKITDKWKGINMDYVVPMPDGTIYSSSAYLSDVYALYPNGGYDVYESHCALLSNGEIVAVTKEDTRISIGTVKMSQGKPADYTYLSDISIPFNHYHDLYGWCESTSHVVFSQLSMNDTPLDYFVLDRNNNSLRIVSLEEFVNLSPNRMFGGRCWELKIDSPGKFGINWLDPEALTTGTLEIDIPGFDVNGDKTQEDYESGKVVLYGTLRSDGSDCVATVDLSTGKTEIVTKTSNYNTITLTPLN